MMLFCLLLFLAVFIIISILSVNKAGKTGRMLKPGIKGENHVHVV